MKKIYQTLRTSLATMVVLVLGLFTVTTTSSFAQTVPSDCVSGCTSNDVQIQSAYLSDANGNRIGDDGAFICPLDGDTLVYLTLQLTTNTPREGVAIYTVIKVLDETGDPNQGDSITFLSQCFSQALDQEFNRVTFYDQFNWNCDTASEIALTDVYIAWGTGHKDFCAGTNDFRCPATPSKCFQLDPDKFIAIETPKPKNYSTWSCPDVPGEVIPTATFNLKNFEGLVTTSNDVTITWWEEQDINTGDLSVQIIPFDEDSVPYTTPDADQDVYALITSNTPPNPTSVATLSLLVYTSPTVTLSSFSPVCVDADAFALSGGAPGGGNYSGTGVSNGQFDPATAGVGTHTITYSYTDSDGCPNSATANITVNDLPTVTLSAFSDVCVDAAEFALSGGSPANGTYSGTGVSSGQFDPATAGVGTHTITYTY
uniref:hypothetical protein n=1 Tax=Maribellus sediminis TaxID=2696285 RepID=UPI0019820747